MNQYKPVAPKRVLFLITKATWGGAQRYVYDLATHLDSSKYAPHVAYGTTGKLSNDLVQAGIKTHALPSLGRDIALISDIKSFFQILSLIRKLTPDVIHLNSSKAGALGALAGRLCRVPRIIFTVHGWPFKENRGVLARPAIYSISWLTTVVSHEVIVVSKSDEERGRRMPGVADKIHYIANGMEPPQFLTRDEASTGLSIATKNPRVVTITELTANKGIRYAIEAVALLKERGTNISYFVIGDGEERKKLELMVHEKGLSDRVLFLGFVKDAAQYLKAFDVFLLPSVKEGMPYVLFEAVSAELPVATTDVVDPAFLDICNYLTVIEPESPIAIADAIETVLASSAEKKPQEKQSVFPLSIMVEKTAALY